MVNINNSQDYDMLHKEINMGTEYYYDTIWDKIISKYILYKLLPINNQFKIDMHLIPIDNINCPRYKMHIYFKLVINW